jgi:hypothetical protein
MSTFGGDGTGTDVVGAVVFGTAAAGASTFAAGVSGVSVRG